MDWLHGIKREVIEHQDQDIKCSFCNASSTRFTKLSVGHREAYICTDCFAIYEEILAGHENYPQGKSFESDMLDKIIEKIQ